MKSSDQFFIHDDAGEHLRTILPSSHSEGDPLSRQLLYLNIKAREPCFYELWVRARVRAFAVPYRDYKGRSEYTALDLSDVKQLLYMI